VKDVSEAEKLCKGKKDLFVSVYVLIWQFHRITTTRGIRPINLALICQECELGLTFCHYQLNPEPSSIPLPTIPTRSTRKTRSWRGRSQAREQRRSWESSPKSNLCEEDSNQGSNAGESKGSADRAGSTGERWGVARVGWFWCNGRYGAGWVN
jgi:hypothetical protein